MKKRLLFVIESLVCAGAEKSLVTLLNLLDYSKYDVDLQLFSYGGEFEQFLPKDVHLLPQLPYFRAVQEPMSQCLSRRKSRKDWLNMIARLSYSLRLRIKHHSNPEKAVLFWKSTHAAFSVFEKEYDVAIAYAQSIPTFYVSDCIRAKKKLAWVNVTFKPSGIFREFNLQHYLRFDHIVCVSEDTKQVFQQHFPEVAEKALVIHDINDGKMIEKLSKLPSNAEKEMQFSGVKLLTVGRLAPQKGYDIAIGAAQILAARKIHFRWYILGRGALENEIKAQIHALGLDDYFVFLGTRDNPYPYYKQADIYVQTSRFEGFGLAIAEARILNIPVVTTNFSAVYAQMRHKQNGLVVEMNASAVAEGIMELLSNPDLYFSIKNYLSFEQKGNIQEINKIYDVIEM